MRSIPPSMLEEVRTSPVRLLLSPRSLRIIHWNKMRHLAFSLFSLTFLLSFFNLLSSYLSLENQVLWLGKEAEVFGVRKRRDSSILPLPDLRRSRLEKGGERGNECTSEIYSLIPGEKTHQAPSSSSCSSMRSTASLVDFSDIEPAAIQTQEEILLTLPRRGLRCYCYSQENERKKKVSLR